jgi:hypothetical protein
MEVCKRILYQNFNEFSFICFLNRVYKIDHAEDTVSVCPRVLSPELFNKF